MKKKHECRVFLELPARSSCNVNATQIARLALQTKLPSISAFKTPFADAGLMMTFGTEPLSVYARAAVFVNKILRGPKLADLPVEEPQDSSAGVNMKTVQALGVMIPE